MSSRRSRPFRLASVPAALLACLVVAAPTLAVVPKTTRVSISSAEVQGNAASIFPSISADGRYVAFASVASNLVANDTNGTTDVFVRDRQAGTTRRVSISSTGTQGNGGSYYPSISADGRYVAFESDATNLVASDTNGTTDIFVRDRQAGTTRRVSISSAELQGNGGSYYPSISADGRYVAFDSDATNLVANDTNGTRDVFVRDRQAGTTTRVSISSAELQGNSYSYAPSISADGRYVAFQSDATNLVANDTNGTSTSSCATAEPGTTRRVSISSAGTQGNGNSDSPSISADGRYVAFHSDATNLVADDTNGASDVFVRDRQAGTTTRVCVSSRGPRGTAAATTRRSRPTAATSPSSRTPPTSSPATRTAPPTSSCATARRAPPRGSPSAPRGPRGTATATPRPSRPTAATSPSTRSPPTSSPVTRTAPPTSSCAVRSAEADLRHRRWDACLR